MVPVAIALGSNLGDRRLHLTTAVDALGAWLQDIRVSEFIETPPEGVAPQPPFLNGALVATSAASPAALLATMLALERQAGRERPYPGAPRPLDLDLILFGSAVIDEPGLVVPHPRFRDRGFVLEPLASVAPDMIDPVTGKTVRELYQSWRGRHPCV